jgi:hypothetical protein
MALTALKVKVHDWVGEMQEDVIEAGQDTQGLLHQYRQLRPVASAAGQAVIREWITGLSPPARPHHQVPKIARQYRDAGAHSTVWPQA